MPDLKEKLNNLNNQYDDARRAGDFKVADSIKRQINEIKDNNYKVQDSIINQIDDMPEELEEGVQYEEPFGQNLGNYDNDEKQVSLAQKKEKELQQQALGNAPKEEIPGGSAIKVNKEPKGTKAKIENMAGQKVDGIKNAVADKAKQKVGDFIKDKLKKEALKKLAASLVANPYFWIVAAIILGVIALIIIIAIFWGSITSIGKGPSVTGQSFTQAADPLSDKDWVRKVLMMTGDKDVGKMLSNEVLDGLAYDLNSLKNENIDQGAKDKISQLLGLIESFKTSRNEEVGNQIIEGVKGLENLIWNVSPFPSSVQTRWPIAKNTLLSASFNKTPHKGTPTYPCSVKGNVCDGHRTFIQFKQDTCDATDIAVNNGTEVYAAFNGKVVSNSSKSGLRIEATDSAGSTYAAIYAHMTDGKPVGTEVSGNDVIGKVGDGHLHFELAVNNRCVVVTPQEYVGVKSRGERIGAFLWGKMQKTLNLN